MNTATTFPHALDNYTSGSVEQGGTGEAPQPNDEPVSLKAEKLNLSTSDSWDLTSYRQLLSMAVHGEPDGSSAPLARAGLRAATSGLRIMR